MKNTEGLEIFGHQLYIGIPQENIFFVIFGYSANLFIIFCGRVSLKCYYDQIIDIHFFTFSYTIGLS